MSLVPVFGMWSGPHYSAGIRSPGEGGFDVRGWNPVYNTYKGVNAFDNYIAKPHDLNEIYAEINFIADIEESGLMPLKTDSGLKLKFGGEETGRFVDIFYYIDSAQNPQMQSMVATAAYKYLQHIKVSNLQFISDVQALDSLYNIPDSGIGAYLLHTALGDQFFAGEVYKVDSLLRILEARFPGISETSGWQDYLLAHFRYSRDMDIPDYNPGGGNGGAVNGDTWFEIESEYSRGDFVNGISEEDY